MKFLVGAIGLEPTTPTMSRWCSNQLSYAPEKLNFISKVMTVQIIMPFRACAPTIWSSCSFYFQEFMEQIRLSKFMSLQGLCSRREADSYIERGRVFVDGKR